jgi:hypothetical protein
VNKDTRVVTIVAARTSDGVPILFADDLGTSNVSLSPFCGIGV